MHVRFRSLLASIALLAAGCASAPRVENPPPVDPFAHAPQTVLAGATLEQARSVAMGAARVKGWNLLAAEPRRILLERELPRDAPQAVALGARSDAASPRVQVETHLAEQPQGTRVALRAFMTVNPGAQDERRIDYTEGYADALAVSLEALQNTWLATQRTVAQTAPPPPPPPASPAPYDFLPIPRAAPPASSATAVTPPRAAAVAPPASSTAAVTAPPAPRASAAAPPAASSRPATPTATRAPAPPSASAGPRPPVNEMLVLDRSLRKGLWTYYAEHYARARGCELSEDGAVLLRKTPEREIHEVRCKDGTKLLLGCQGDLCQSLR